jgi:hypothetical protein
MRSETLADLASKAIVPSAVRNEPLLRQLPAVKTSELDQDQPAVSRNLHKNRGETRGDVSIRGLWTRGTDCIIDVRVTDTDAKSNLQRPRQGLGSSRKEKKKYPLPRATSYFHSIRGLHRYLIGKEAKTC